MKLFLYNANPIVIPLLPSSQSIIRNLLQTNRHMFLTRKYSYPTLIQATTKRNFTLNQLKKLGPSNFIYPELILNSPIFYRLLNRFTRQEIVYAYTEMSDSDFEIWHQTNIQSLFEHASVSNQIVERMVSDVKLCNANFEKVLLLDDARDNPAYQKFRFIE